MLLLAVAAPSGGEAAVRAWLGGTGFFLAVNAFLFPTVGPFMVPLAMLLAVLWLPLGWLAWALLGGAGRPGPRRLAAAMVLVPSAFVAGEALRSWEALGGPWGLLGASQWNAPALLSVAALGGVWGLSFLLVAVNVAVAVAVGRRVPGPTRATAAAAAVALPLAALGLLVAAAGPATGRDGPGGVRPARGRRPRRGAVLGQRAAQPLPARRAPGPTWWCGARAASAATRAASPGDVARLAGLARPPGAPVLANVDAQRETGRGDLQERPAGRRQRGCRAATTRCGWCRSASTSRCGRCSAGSPGPPRPRASRPAPRDPPGRAARRQAGRRPADLLRVGLPRPGRNLAADGADLVVVQSADPTFQGSWGLDQHASLSAVRAVESGRPVLQAALSGTSAAFDARGRRLAWAPGGWRGAAVVELPLSAERTPYVRAGDVVPLACWVALAVGAVAAVATRRRRLSRDGSGRRTGSTPRSTPARPRR